MINKWEAIYSTSHFSHSLGGLAVNLGFDGLLAPNIHLDLLGLGFGLLGKVNLQHALVVVSAHLPNTLDAEKVSANYDKGVLKITVAKKAEAKPKQIKVHVGSEKTLEAKAAGKAA